MTIGDPARTDSKDPEAYVFQRVESLDEGRRRSTARKDY